MMHSGTFSIITLFILLRRLGGDDGGELRHVTILHPPRTISPSEQPPLICIPVPPYRASLEYITSKEGKIKRTKKTRDQGGPRREKTKGM